ncbi:CBS domain-containing protein, partial [Pseudophaeobacter arcticus]|uniref:CBS domain-containing protein n=1 Tax=Pseudophaeobacter arcticus TaxID=385492 RepID=UPI0031EC6556
MVDFFQQYRLASAAVVNTDGALIGVITVDDIVDVISEEAEEDILRLGGVTEDDLFGSIWSTSRARFLWLFVNLLTAIAASVAI